MAETGTGDWQQVCTLGAQRQAQPGEQEALARHLGAGADLRIGTRFRHNEHIDVTSTSNEVVAEVAEFPVTYLVANHWAAGVMTRRQPVELPDGFGARPSMSFFLYNQDGSQAIARPYLDGRATGDGRGRSPDCAPPNMPRYEVLDTWDADTNAPSQNFVYQFEEYRFFVRGGWQALLGHDAQGEVLSGSPGRLAERIGAGAECKLGCHGLCSDLAAGPSPAHTLFVQANSLYYYPERELLVAATHPLVRVRPGVPLRYGSEGWDFGWLLARTDGQVVYRRCDPYTLQFSDHRLRLALTWFAR